MSDHDDRLMQEYLLGTLSVDDAELVDDRLATDPEFFEQMEAFEDDLILRWHRAQLSSNEGAAFERAYATDARQERIRKALRLVDVVSAATHVFTAHASPLRGWWPPPFTVPRWAIGIPLLVAAVILVMQPWRGASTSGDAVLTVELTAEGERGGVPARGYDVVALEPHHAEVRFRLTVTSAAGEPPFVVEVTAIDRRDRLIVTAPDLEWVAESRSLSITIPAGDLGAGDYILAVRPGSDPNTGVVLRHAFRVSRLRP